MFVEGEKTVHLEERLLLGLDTVQQRRVRKPELVIVGGLEREVRLRLGNSLDERLEVATVTLNLESIEMENIRDRVVQEARVMRHNDYTTISKQITVKLYLK